MKRLAQNPNFALILIFIYILISIIALSFSAPHGYLSPDSSHYLRASERIISGHGLYVPANGRIGPDEHWFAVWPAGYPILISFVSWISGLSSFASSKIVNSLLIFLAIYSLYSLAGRNGLIVSLILLSAGTLINYTMTWSEAPFVTFLVILCLYAGKLVNQNSNISNVQWLIFTILIILPFTARYIGIFVVAPVGILSIYFLSLGRKGDAVKIIVSIAFAILVCALYLWYNQIQTGYATGMDRLTAQDTHYDLLKALLLSVVRELVLIFPSYSAGIKRQDDLIFAFWLLGALLTLVILTREFLRKRARHMSYTSVIFIIFGFFYLASIVFARWTTGFDRFSHRLIDPGFALIYIGICFWLLEQGGLVKKATTYFLVFSAIIVAAINIHALANNYLNRESYEERISTIEERFSIIPENSIVVSPENDLRYLRPNLQMAYPGYRETWEEFIEDLDPRHDVYISTSGHSRNLGRYDESVRDALEMLPPNSIVILER